MHRKFEILIKHAQYLCNHLKQSKQIRLHCWPALSNLPHRLFKKTVNANCIITICDGFSTNKKR